MSSTDSTGAPMMYDVYHQHARFLCVMHRFSSVLWPKLFIIIVEDIGASALRDQKLMTSKPAFFIFLMSGREALFALPSQ